MIKKSIDPLQQEKVANQKRDAVANPKKFLSQLGLGAFAEIEKLFNYRKNMDYGDEIDFNKCRDFFKAKLPKGKMILVFSRNDFIISVPHFTINLTNF